MFDIYDKKISFLKIHRYLYYTLSGKEDLAKSGKGNGVVNLQLSKFSAL